MTSLREKAREWLRKKVGFPAEIWTLGEFGRITGYLADFSAEQNKELAAQVKQLCDDLKACQKDYSNELHARQEAEERVRVLEEELRPVFVHGVCVLCGHPEPEHQRKILCPTALTPSPTPEQKEK